ncbi:MAG: 3-isopropylmalate dehydratase small subunit [bacterium]
MGDETIRGRVWKFGDHVDTDLIIPATYLDTTDPERLGRHAMEGADPQFAANVRRGDVIVAGANFGCGSSREHAPLALSGAGVACVAAESFARIFFRNAINLGLPVFEAPGIHGAASQGDVLEIDPARREIRNVTTGAAVPFSPYPGFIQSIIAAGGLIPLVRLRLGEGRFHESV